MGQTPPFFIFLRAKPFFFMGWAFLTFKGLIPYFNFESQHPVSLNAQEKNWDDRETKTKRMCNCWEIVAKETTMKCYWDGENTNFSLT